MHNLCFILSVRYFKYLFLVHFSMCPFKALAYFRSIGQFRSYILKASMKLEFASSDFLPHEENAKISTARFQWAEPTDSKYLVFRIHAVYYFWKINCTSNSFAFSFKCLQCFTSLTPCVHNRLRIWMTSCSLCLRNTKSFMKIWHGMIRVMPDSS